MKNWNNYIKQNKIGSDCQLVTAVNAYHYLTGRRITDKRYERFVDLCCCRHGSAIGIEKVWKELGIQEKARYEHPFDWEADWEKMLPIELSVWHKFFGFHSALVVEFEPRTEALRVTGLKHVTSMDGWIFREDLEPHLVLNPDKTEPRWKYRTFEITER